MPTLIWLYETLRDAVIWLVDPAWTAVTGFIDAHPRWWFVAAFVFFLAWGGALTRIEGMQEAQKYAYARIRELQRDLDLALRTARERERFQRRKQRDIEKRERERDAGRRHHRVGPMR